VDQNIHWESELEDWRVQRSWEGRFNR